MTVIRRYADLTIPTPAYGGAVRTAFSPSKWKHFLVAEDGTLEELAGVTSILKKAVDKSQPLMKWAVRLALARVRALVLETGIGGDGAIQIFTEELDKILESARKADTEALETAGDIGHQAHAIIEQIIKGIIAKDDRRMDEVFSTLPDDPRVVNAVIAFVSWLDAHNVRFIKTEFRALSLKHKCCGTADGLAYCDSCNDKECCPTEFKDRLSLIDHKTSNGLYTTYLFQTAFYVAAHEEEFPEIGLIQDRWVNRLDKDDASFDPWHAEGREAQAEDLEGFLCCLALIRALAVTEKRMSIIVDARKAIKSARKALEKIERDKIECPKFKDYKGQKLTKCLPSGEQCAACSAKFKEMHP